MRIEALEAFGVDEELIAVWRKTGHEQLLPIQDAAVRRGKALEGKSLVVFSPTSSGKTFVAEMAALHLARNRKRVLYLVPLKALAEEKYQEFSRNYSPLGIRTVISTRDHREFDKDLANGSFHIAVVVFEKLQSLLVADPGLLKSIGLVVVDELQMLADKSRGADLELLLTKIRTVARHAQLIGLSAVLGSSQRIADWLGADLIADTHRPVELRKGVYCQGKFTYVEHNSGQAGEETLWPDADILPEFETRVGLATHLAQRNESCLVFCRTKQDCVRTALCVARGLRSPQADDALEELDGLEESQGKDLLERLLQRGVAYHNADLDVDQRRIVERHFRQGDIKVVCATSTLAMGLNLPAKNVLVDTRRYEQPKRGRGDWVDITQVDYENMAGRAGRLGLEQDFGRAIIVTESAFNVRCFLEGYAKGKPDDLAPALADDPLAQHVLDLVASEVCRTEPGIAELLLSSYTGSLLWRGGEREAKFRRDLSEDIQRCVRGGLVARARDGVLSATSLGRLAAVKGVTVDTAVQMGEFARRHLRVAHDVSLLEVLMCLAFTEDGERAACNLPTREFQAGQYLPLLKSAITRSGPGVQGRLKPILEMTALTYERAKRAKKMLALHEWIAGVPTREIEGRYHIFSGSLYGMGVEFSWLADTFAEVASLCRWPEQVLVPLRCLPDQLTYGVPAGCVEVAGLRVPGLARGRAMLLVADGLDTLEKIAAAPQARLQRLITKPVAARLTQRVSWIMQRREALEEAEQPAHAAELYPLCDPAGVPYLSNSVLHLDGRLQNNRYMVRVNDAEAGLREQSFEALAKLAVAALTTPLGWVSIADFGTPDTYHMVLQRLREDLRSSGVDALKLVQNNRAKKYRLSVPPRHIKVNVAQLRRLGVPGSEKLVGNRAAGAGHSHPRKALA